MFRANREIDLVRMRSIFFCLHYSIDEVLMDLTPYLKTYSCPPVTVHSLEDGATARERNGTIGGHKA